MSAKINKRQIFQKASTTYYYSSLFFSPEIWEMVATLYAYVRIADDFVDQIPQDKQGFSNFLRETLDFLRTKQPPQTPTNRPIIVDFINLAKDKKIKLKWIVAFLRSMAADLAPAGSWIRYESNTQLDQYIYGSAEVIGLMMCQILGLPASAHAAARAQGAAMQRINFIRDLKEDSDLKRNYLPNAILYKKPNSAAEIDAFSQTIATEIAIFTETQTAAERGYHYIPYRYRVPIMAAAALYRWTAEKIAADPGIVWRTKVKPRKAKVALTLLQSMVKCLFY